MNEETEERPVEQNPLGTEKIGTLVGRYAIPAIISMLVNSLYNMVDQVFIGNGVGMLGNAATNVAFPIVTFCTACALLLGIGGSSNYNLAAGRGEKEQAARFIGTALTSIVIVGICLMALILIFLDPLLNLCGATEDVLPYAQAYEGITAFGIPFFMLSAGGSHLIRADGNPNMSMASTLVGAVLNMILDPIYIFVFHWGIQGAAIATITGQIVSAVIVVFYFARMRNVQLNRDLLKPRMKLIGTIASLGVAAFINQIAMGLAQVVMNDTLRYYGAFSIYGTDIPLACVGVISKINAVFMALCVGISQGCQPIWGFNRGAKKYGRVRHTYWYAFRICLVIGIVFFAAFQLFPVQIVSLFGTGSDLYYQFAKQYFRVFMFMTFINGVQPMSSGFFTSNGKAGLGIIVSLTRQVIFMIPCILIFASMFGIDGVIYAGPIADGAAFIVAFSLAMWQINKMKKLEEEEEQAEEGQAQEGQS